MVEVCPRGQTVLIFRVKTGILGRSRSAVSGRNRFYQPSDAVRFRALNSLSPEKLGRSSVAQPLVHLPELDARTDERCVAI